MGMVLMLGVYPLSGTSVYHLLTHQTSKNAYLGMVSMLSICPPFFTHQSLKKCPDEHIFDALPKGLPEKKCWTSCRGYPEWA